MTAGASCYRAIPERAAGAGGTSVASDANSSMRRSLSCWVAAFLHPILNRHVLRPHLFAMHCRQGERSLGATLSLRKANANSTAILFDEFNARFLERGYKFFSGFGPTANVAICGLQPLHGRHGNPGLRSQVILRPTEQGSGRLYLPN